MSRGGCASTTGRSRMLALPLDAEQRSAGDRQSHRYLVRGPHLDLGHRGDGRGVLGRAAVPGAYRRRRVRRADLRRAGGRQPAPLARLARHVDRALGGCAEPADLRNARLGGRRDVPCLRPRSGRRAAGDRVLAAAHAGWAARDCGLGIARILQRHLEAARVGDDNGPDRDHQRAPQLAVRHRARSGHRGIGMGDQYEHGVRDAVRALDVPAAGSAPPVPNAPHLASRRAQPDTAVPAWPADGCDGRCRSVRPVAFSAHAGAAEPGRGRRVADHPDADLGCIHARYRNRARKHDTRRAVDRRRRPRLGARARQSHDRAQRRVHGRDRRPARALRAR